jgi:molybdopterin-containing oxidoreductase family membrane subunit
MAQVLGLMKNPEDTVSAIEELKSAGFKELEIYSPVPSHAIEEALDRGPSPLRLWTLIGCLTGVTFAYFMQIWVAYDWPLVVGGKPFASIVPDTIIGFELNILLGGLSTVAGLMFFGMFLTRKGHEAYQPGFSGDVFGCIVSCHGDQVARAQEVLRRVGSTEVRVVEG